MIREYGPKNAKTIMLLHGGGLSWWNYRAVAELLQDSYRIILPVLDGHAGSERSFRSIEDNAVSLIEFIDRQLNGSAEMIAGLSLGGQILLEMLAQRQNVCRHALVESAMVKPSGLTGVMIGPAVKAAYGLTRNRSFAKLQFRALHMEPDMFEDYYRDTCRISKSDMAAFMKASTLYSLREAVSGIESKVWIYAGSRETRGILESAELIHRMIPSSSLTVLEGLYHGEFSMHCAKLYADTVRQILGS